MPPLALRPDRNLVLAFSLPLALSSCANAQDRQKTDWRGAVQAMLERIDSTTPNVTVVLRQERPGEWRVAYSRPGDNRDFDLDKQERLTLDALHNDWANLARYRDANAKLAAPGSNEHRVVFMGNSITEGWAQYFSTMFRGKPYINRGIGGQTTPQMVVRFHQDVIALKPTVVLILGGINDIAGTRDPPRWR